MKICKVFKVLTEAVPLPAELESDRQGKQTVHKLLRSHFAKTNKKTETNTEKNTSTETNTNADTNVTNR